MVIYFFIFGVIDLVNFLFIISCSFYIILRGTVAIFINNAISDEDDLSKVAERLEEAEKKAHDEKGELDRSVFGNYIGPIGQYLNCMTEVQCTFCMLPCGNNTSNKFTNETLFQRLAEVLESWL